jgi:prepilin-type N-terminal cleavage/methylation domain-containing protein/prepilin-type processing-associated H-X9-DG protein
MKSKFAYRPARVENGVRGFTLIELLVVIAIIAILAAILFPVFAQAREQARKTACLSNSKQLTTAILMYGQDYDETFVPFVAFQEPLLRDNGTVYRNYSPWTALIQPYVKNKFLTVCPDEAQLSFVMSGNNRSLLYGGYGLNYGYLSRYAGSDPYGNDLWIPLKFAAVNRPAQVVLFLDSVGVDYATADHKYVWVPVGTTVDPPINCYAYANTDCDSYSNGWTGQANDYTKYYDFPGYGGASFRHNSTGYQSGVIPQGGANVAFVDGHSKYQKVGALVAGTNFQPDGSGNAKVIDTNAYEWDPSY